MNKTTSILIADDNQDILQHVLGALTDAGYKTMVAPNGRIACEIAKLKQPDLIIMDWVMPEMNGIDAIKSLKSTPETSQIPVIMLTSQSNPEDLKMGLETGAIDYIKKPFNKIELLARVNANLQLIESYRQIQHLKVEQAERKTEIQELKNKELKNEIQSKAKTLQATGFTLAQKNKVIEDVYSRIQTFVSENNVSSPILLKLLDELDDTRHSDHSMQEFTDELNQLNHQLISYLRNNFPDLTSVELKICSMISLGLSNKEIANLLFLSIRTVESHRYHASKKLDLDQGLTLKKFISNLRY